MATMTTRRNINIDGLQVQTDLHQLKELSNKLNLATRRPSVVQWKQFLSTAVSGQHDDATIKAIENPTKNENTEDVSARYRRVGQMFEKLRRDLVIMRIEDNKLARKLLDVRSEMNLVRAQKSCAEHADMLDDVTIELEEEEELTGLIKGKPTSLLSAFSPLRNIGVSRMNLNRRRFSIR
uniref:Uncharacterized protein n=1 Tax=Ciona intestinalis TaxID=7719 RepID=H2XQA8_CIOIN